MIAAEFFDYSPHQIAIGHLNRRMHDALIRGDYAEAERIAGEIVVHARAVRVWCVHARNA
jgi:hypothetical protein